MGLLFVERDKFWLPATNDDKLGGSGELEKVLGGDGIGKCAHELLTLAAEEVSHEDDQHSVLALIQALERYQFVLSITDGKVCDCV